jgi:hypothetical protein
MQELAERYVREADEAGARYDTATNETYRALDALDAATAKVQAAKATLTDAELDATLEAYAEGKVTGKNAEERDRQLKDHLRTVPVVAEARSALETAEAEHRAAKLAIDKAQANAAYARHLCNLRVAQLNVLAGGVA